MGNFKRILLALGLATSLTAIGQTALAADDDLTWSKVFTPDTIGPGSVSMLSLTIVNNVATPDENIAFTDDLPASVTIADDTAFHDCDAGVLSAPKDGGTITFSGGEVGTLSECTVNVNVKSSTVATHTNTTGDLTSDAGNHGPATADLTVEATLPGFSKSFSPSTVDLNGRSTLTFLIDNTDPDAGNVNTLDFTDVMPAGMVVASPALASTDCGNPLFPPTLTATPGSSTITLSAFGAGEFPALYPEDTCTVTVDVIGTAAGTLTNVVELLTDDGEIGTASAGFASADLIVNPAPPGIVSISKSFSAGRVAPGDTVDLTFTLTNTDRDDAATGITFTDDLATILSGTPDITATLPSTPDPACGPGSTFTGSAGDTFLTLSGASLAPDGASCSFTVTLNVPVTAPGGVHTNATSPVTATIGGTPVEGNVASAVIEVLSWQPIAITKDFTDDNVLPGGTATLVFTLENPNPVGAADVSFEDEFTSFQQNFEFVVPAVHDCGGSVDLSDPNGFNNGSLALSLGSIDPSDSCEITVTLNINPTATPDTYPNTTSPVTATFGEDDSATVGITGGSDSLVVGPGGDLNGLQITKSFGATEAAVNSDVEVTFTLANRSAITAQGIAFTDDLENDFLAGTTVNSLGASTCGGALSGVGTSTFGFSGGTLAPEDPACKISFIATLGPAVPSSNPATNTTSDLTAGATVGTAAPILGTAAEADLLITQYQPLAIAKAYSINPTVAGGSVTLAYTITNPNPTPAGDATNVGFLDNLADVIPGLGTGAVVGTNTCGFTVTPISDFFLFSAGSLAGLANCTVELDLTVPLGAGASSYNNATSAVTADIGGGPTTGNTASANLVVVEDAIEWSKEFTSDPVAPGGTVNLRFTIDNLVGQTVDDISFTDDLASMLGGTTASGLPIPACGGTLSASAGDTLLTLANGSLGAEASCSFNVTVNVPAGADGDYLNTTSGLSGLAGAAPVTADAVTDTLIVTSNPTATFTKTIDPSDVTATGSTTMTLFIQNNDPVVTLSQLSFTDDLDGLISGMAVTSGTGSDTCGPGSSVVFSGGVLELMDGNLRPGENCSIALTVSFPVTAPPGGYTNETSNLTEGSTTVAGKASAPFSVQPPPTFTKSFSPDTIGIQGDPSTLTFTIDNSASTLDATALGFTDNLPGGVAIADTPNASTTCVGMGDATAGATSFSFGGEIAAGASCTVQFDVIGTAAGTHVNTTEDLTSSSGNSGPATDTLTVVEPPEFSKSFSPDTIVPGAVSTLTFAIDNTGRPAATALAFSDTLPSGMTVASSGATGNSCGGTVTAATGTDQISLTGGTVAAAGNCEIAVDVTSDVSGANTTGDLTSSLGNSGPASADLTVFGLPTFAKTFIPDEADQGGTVEMEFVIGNENPSLAISDVEFLDPFPAGLVLASTPTASPECGAPDLRGDPGDVRFRLLGATIPAQSDCIITMTVTVTATTDQTLTNTTHTLKSSAGQVSGVSADLAVYAASPLDLTKTFELPEVTQGDTLEMMIAFENTSAFVTATGVEFTDPFDAGLVIASAPVLDGCGSPTVNAPIGGTSITFSAGEVLPAETCEITLDVQVTGALDLSNTIDDLTSSLGDSAAVTANLRVNMAPPPLFDKLFVPDEITVSDTSTLTYSIDNAVALIPATGITFDDNLPTGVTIAASPGVSTDCPGALVTASPSTSLISVSGATLAPGANCQISVVVTSDTVGTYPSTSGDLTSSLGNSGPASDTLDVKAIVNGSVTFVQITDTDGTFGFTSSEPLLTFQLTTTGLAATSGPITLPANNYLVNHVPPAGFGNSEITCSDDDSIGDPYNRTIDLNIDAGEAVVCRIRSVKSDQITIDTINRFLTRRADLILSSEPRLSRRFERLNAGFGTASPLTFSTGDLGAMVPFSFDPMSIGSGNYRFSTSMLQMRRAAASVALAHGATRDTMYVENYRFDAWFEAQYKLFDDGAAGEGHFGIAYLGGDYVISPNLLVGALIQVDDMEDNSASLNTSASGVGWMVGPYMTARLAPSLYFDARIAAGKSTNKVSPFNTYTDTFHTDRWMAMMNLTGEFQRGAWTIRPNASLAYFEETQASYVDSLAVTIPSQTVKLGQLKIGPTFSGRFETQNGGYFEPTISFEGIYNIGETTGVTITTPTSPAVEGWRGRIEAGLAYTTDTGARIAIGGTYDGLFRDDYETIGLKFDLTIPLKKNKAR